MNHVRKPVYEMISEADGDIVALNFNMQEEVTSVVVDTLLGRRHGCAGSIAYLDNGAALYEAFKRAHLPNQDASQSEAARLISTHKSSILEEMNDPERLIIIGGGSGDSIKSQELALIGNLFAHQNKPKLREVVLVDVSIDFLRSQIQAVKEFSQTHNASLKIMPILGGFHNVSHDFDSIMAGFQAAPKEEIKAAVITTGGTFGNISGVSLMDRLPRAEIDVQMAHLGNFVGQGSSVILDYFTNIDSGQSYYQTRELSEFFNNVPNIMRAHCPKLQKFNANASAEYDNYFTYRARALPQARMIVHELVAVAPQMPVIVNGVTRVCPIDIHDSLCLMFSLRANTADISSRPVQNTGLATQQYVSRGNLVMHMFRKVGEPAAIFQPEITYISTPEPTPAISAGLVSRVTDAGRRIIDNMAPLRAFGSPA